MSAIGERMPASLRLGPAATIERFPLERIMAKQQGRPKPPELQRVLDATGGVAALAQLLNLSPRRVACWRTIPTEYAIEVEAKIGLARERARPDRTVTRRGG
jgi:hypothetical protein